MRTSNPVVFPFKPFTDLSLPIRNNIVGDVLVTKKEIQRLLATEQLPPLKISGKTSEEKIFSLFLDPNIRFGHATLITSLKKYWISQIAFFIRQNKPIEFTLLGFPGKAPVALKTDRTFPDFGELLSLNRLYAIAKQITTVYKPGARITIITEGFLGHFIGIPLRIARKYEQQLQNLITDFGFQKNIRTIPIERLTKYSGYKKTFNNLLLRAKKDFKNRKPEIHNKFKLGYDSIFHLLSTRSVPLEVVKKVYKKERDPKLKKTYALFHARTIDAFLRYYAFLKTRDALEFLHREVPHALPLTVSPKKYRLGIHLIHAKADLLAHHGVPVGSSIAYLHSLRASKDSYVRVFLKNDKEKKPFLYLPVST